MGGYYLAKSGNKHIFLLFKELTVCGPLTGGTEQGAAVPGVGGGDRG